jgi:hypothetical protein
MFKDIDMELRFKDQLVLWSSIAMSLVPLVPYALEGMAM